jgi:hypothetical protein
MPAIIEGPPGRDDAPSPAWKRWSWFVGIALGAAVATALVAYALKALLPTH